MSTHSTRSGQAAGEIFLLLEKLWVRRQKDFSPRFEMTGLRVSSMSRVFNLRECQCGEQRYAQAQIILLMNRC